MAGLFDNLRDVAQGASNSVAGNLTAPVDGINWLLRKAGVPVSDMPVGGSDWLRQKGLTAEPKNANYGLLGEALGGVTPMLIAAKAPQIASGLLKAGDNMAIPNTMNPQTGAIYLSDGKLTSNIDDATQAAKMIERLDKTYKATIDQAGGGSVYLTVQRQPLTKSGEVAKNRNPFDLGFKARFADHPSYHGSSISSDPFTGNTVDDVLRGFQRNQGSPAQLGEQQITSSFDPRDRLGVVRTKVFQDAISNRGNPVQKWVDLPDAPFTFLK